MLDKIEDILQSGPSPLVQDDWWIGIERWGRDVAMYRRYYDGDHKTFLTDEMKDMLRSDEGFRDNYCELVVHRMADRLTVRSIETGDEGLDEWVTGTRDRVDYDALQLDLHQAVVRDGDAFVMVEYDEDGQAVDFHLEEVWDNVEGVIPVYDRKRQNLLAAVKVWYEVTGRMVRFYYPDRTSLYRVVEDDTGEKDQASGLNIVPVEGRIDEPWLPGVVPLVHFKVGAGSRSIRGRSVLKPAIPMQDILNRTLVSMVMTGEMASFGLRYAIGFEPPRQLAPGSWVIAGAEGVSRETTVEMGTLDQAEVVPYIEQANFIIEEISTVTQTPLPRMGGATESGEARKERKDGLTSKVERAQVRLGTGWRQVWEVARTVHNAYNVMSLDEEARFTPRWKDAQVRNATELREHAESMADRGYEREYLRLMGQVLGYDAEKVERLLAEKADQEREALAMLGGSTPGFEQFITPGLGVAS